MQTFQNQSESGAVRSDIQSSAVVRGGIVLLGLALIAFLGAKTASEIRYPGPTPIQPVITVSGKGEALVVPDIATVGFSVTAESPVVGTAQDESAEKINAIVASLKEQGVAEKDIKTTGYNIYPRYEYQDARVGFYPSGARTLAAYVVTQSVEVKIRDLSKAGPILSSLGSLGATDVSGLSFGVDEEDAPKAIARTEAIKDAQTKAEAMAKALGVRLVRVVSFNEDGGYAPMYRAVALESAMGSADAAIPALPAGENTITSNVTVTYEIR